MAKNLKLQVKNTQIAGAINLKGLKAKLSKKKDDEPAAVVEKKKETSAEAAKKQAPKQVEPKKQVATVESSKAEATHGEAKTESRKEAVEKSSAAPKVEKSEPEVIGKTVSKPAMKAETKSEIKPETKSETRSETKPEVKPLAKPELKAESKPEPKPQPKPEPKLGPVLDARPELTRPIMRERKPVSKAGWKEVPKARLDKRGPARDEKPRPGQSRGPRDARSMQPFSRPPAPKKPERKPAEKVQEPPQKMPTTRDLQKELFKGPKVKEKEAPKASKKFVPKNFDARMRHGLRGSDDDDQVWRKKRSHKMQKQQSEQDIIRPSSITVRLPISVKELAQEMKYKATELISKLFMQGLVVTLNDDLDDETVVQLVGEEFGCTINIDTSEEERIQITDKTIKEEIAESDQSACILRAPVVAFMGHVDHGKTSIIDSIRKSNITQSEVGAITQHIGAFSCHTQSGDITILDTPGHEAFSHMRERGAEVTDIVVLVVAGDEGMKAQTFEALEQAQKTDCTIVVAINKCDKPAFDTDTVYRQLSEKNLLPEAWGGQTITVNCSAKTGEGIPELLEMLALQAEVLELKANPEMRARGAVIESQLCKGLGPVATVLVQNGTLKLQDCLVFGHTWAKVKTMRNEEGKAIEEAGPSQPVRINGLSGLPESGDAFIVVDSEKEAREIAEVRSEGKRQSAFQAKRKITLEGFHEKQVEKKVVTLMLVADVQGSLEALKNAILRIASDKVEVNIISATVGMISESDVERAQVSKAHIIGFHTQIESHVEPIVKELNVDVRLHGVIYHAVDDVKEIMRSKLDKIREEKDTGKLEVRQVFKSSHLGMIAGCQMLDGIITRNSFVRVIREGKQIHKGSVLSLKRHKDDVREVQKGMECGVLLTGFSAFQEGDILEVFVEQFLEQEL